jgi:hypothetical protein
LQFLKKKKKMHNTSTKTTKCHKKNIKIRNKRKQKKNERKKMIEETYSIQVVMKQLFVDMTNGTSD